MISFEYEEKTTLEDALMQLYTILEHLRSDDGCPWDREQTPREVALNLIDETYEFLDSYIQEDHEGSLEELGDVLLNALMLIEMHQEDSEDGIAALNAVCQKLIRRHPHVFGTSEAHSSDEVINLWNSIKVEVEGRRESKEDFFSRLASSLPPLEAADRIQKKIGKVGFDWPEVEGVVAKVREELDEVVQAMQENSTDDLEMEIGDLLFAVVNLSRYVGLDPSLALYRSNEKMKRRFNALYALARERSVQLNKENINAMEELWQEIKAHEAD
jgi:MazG family protein